MDTNHNNRNESKDKTKQSKSKEKMDKKEFIYLWSPNGMRSSGPFDSWKLVFRKFQQ